MTDLRRRMLVSVLPLVVIPRFPAGAARVAHLSSVGLLTGWVDGDGASHLVRLDGLEPILQRALGFEPHQILQLPAGGLLAIARKPGEYALHQPRGHEVTANLIEPPPGMYLYGHGAVDRQQRRILFTAQDAARESGQILAFDLQDFRHVGTYPTGGVEPHQILRSRKGQWWLAHGGMRLQPEYWRRHDEMVCGSGVSVAGKEFVFRRMISLLPGGLSLRHLVELPDERMVIAGKTSEPTSHDLMFVADCGDARSLPLAGSARYALSVHADADWVAATFPLDDCIMLWNASRNFQVQRLDIQAPAGICLHECNCFVTTRTGTIIKFLNQSGRWKILNKSEFGGRFTDHLQVI